jgi:trigger factor
MKITKEQVDALNAVITVVVSKEDYAWNVDKVLANHKKTANIQGFRKGEVPMSLIKKQYGKAVLLEEVNKVLQKSLNDYLGKERLDLLGNPLPRVKEEMDWTAEEFTFEFEIGLAPEFNVDLNSKTSLTKFEIVADEEMLNEQVVRIQKQYGKLTPQEKVAEDFTLRGTFTNEEKNINNTTNITLDIFNDKKTAKLFIDKKVGDVVTLETKGLFDDDHKLMDFLKVAHDDVHGLDVPVNFTIEEINSIEKADLTQELFDKLFGDGAVSSVEELKAKIKEDAELQFAQQADQKFLNDAIESLIDNTKFDLPKEFLKKWIQSAGQNPLTAEQAEEEFVKSEKGLRYQLIEGKIIASNNLQIKFEDLKAHTADLIRKQMAQFGQMNPTNEEVEGVVARVLSNQDEAKSLSEQVMSVKMLDLFKEKLSAKSKKVSYQEFVKEMYGE